MKKNSCKATNVIYEKVNEQWEIALAASNSGFQQISFVNSIVTYVGGSHVDNIVNNIVNHLIEMQRN